MANILKGQILSDTNKRTLIKYVGISDGTQFANNTFLDVSNLAYALNANGYIMSSNTHPKSTYRVNVSRVLGYIAMNGAGHVKLQWHGDSNTEIVSVGGEGDFDFGGDILGVIGSGVIPNNEANSSGDILISSLGLGANDTFTIFLEVRKRPEDYDQGQTADPAAFNK